jgi:elongation factor Ts
LSSTEARSRIPTRRIAVAGVVAAQVLGKPPAAAQKIVDGKMEKCFSTVCLLDQTFVTLPEKTIKGILTEEIAKTVENIQVRRFVRFQFGS